MVGVHINVIVTYAKAQNKMALLNQEPHRGVPTFCLGFRRHTAAVATQAALQWTKTCSASSERKITLVILVYVVKVLICMQ
jgi:hypothetical protein